MENNLQLIESAAIDAANNKLPLDTLIETLEKSYYSTLLKVTNSKCHAASIAKKNRGTLRAKLKKYGIINN